MNNSFHKLVIDSALLTQCSAATPIKGVRPLSQTRVMINSFHKLVIDSALLTQCSAATPIKGVRPPGEL